eukprot:gb/GECG01014747.1/.p1 GENE.gb/GECG01014747.1/~~gb/GECG01014747.1/.p1  ORF type:complete len:1110 (+),score=156.17 gb/GECG01014747.1/:1-3330(+)
MAQSQAQLQQQAPHAPEDATGGSGSGAMAVASSSLPTAVANIHKTFPVTGHLMSQRRHRAAFIRDNTTALQLQADSSRLAQKVYRRRQRSTSKRRVQELLMDCSAEVHKSMLRAGALLQTMSIVDFMQAQYIQENANWTLYLQHCMNALVAAKFVSDDSRIAFAPIQPALGAVKSSYAHGSTSTDDDNHQYATVDDVSAYSAALHYLASFLAYDEAASKDLSERIVKNQNPKLGKSRSAGSGQKKTVVVSAARHLGVILRKSSSTPALLSPSKNYGKKKVKNDWQSLRIIDSYEDLFEFTKQRQYSPEHGEDEDRSPTDKPVQEPLRNPAILLLSSTMIEWLGDEMFEESVRADESIDTVIQTPTHLAPLGDVPIPQLIDNVIHRLSSARIYYCLQSRAASKHEGRPLHEAAGVQQAEFEGDSYSLLSAAHAATDYVSNTYVRSEDKSYVFADRGVPFVVNRSVYSHMRSHKDSAGSEPIEGADFAGEYPPILEARPANYTEEDPGFVHFAPAMLQQLIESTQWHAFISEHNDSKTMERIRQVREWFGDQSVQSGIVKQLYVVVDKGSAQNSLSVLYPISSEAMSTLFQTYLLGDDLPLVDPSTRHARASSEKNCCTVEIAVPFHRIAPAVSDTIDAWVSQLQVREKEAQKGGAGTSIIRPLNCTPSDSILVADSFLFRLHCSADYFREKHGYIVFTTPSHKGNGKTEEPSQELELRLSPWIPAYLQPGDPSYNGRFDSRVYQKNRDCCHWRACLRPRPASKSEKDEAAMVQLQSVLPNLSKLGLCEECKRIKTTLAMEYLASKKGKAKNNKQKTEDDVDSIAAVDVPELQRYLPRPVKSSTIGIQNESYAFYNVKWTPVLSTDMLNPRDEPDETWNSYVEGVYSLPSWSSVPRNMSQTPEQSTKSLMSLIPASSWLTQELLSGKLRSTLEGFFSKLKSSQHPPRKTGKQYPLPSGYIFRALGVDILDNLKGISREQQHEKLSELCREKLQQLRKQVESARKIRTVERETTNEVQMLAQEGVYPSRELGHIRAEYENLEYERIQRLGTFAGDSAAEGPSSSPKLMSEGNGGFRNSDEESLESELELRFAVSKRDILRERRVKELRNKMD